MFNTCLLLQNLQKYNLRREIMTYPYGECKFLGVRYGTKMRNFEKKIR